MARLPFSSSHLFASLSKISPASALAGADMPQLSRFGSLKQAGSGKLAGSGLKALRRLYLCALCLPALLSPGLAIAGNSLSLEQIETTLPVEHLLHVPEGKMGESFFAKQGTNWSRIIGCDDGSNGLCLIRATPPATPKLPSTQAKALPDGQVASSSDGDIRHVWLTEPTNNYAHGVLGDAIEAQSVTVQLENGSYRHFQLPADSVFEDLVPRLADLNKDGRNEVVLVRSYLNAGAALAVLGLRNDKLVLLAETKAIGTANRWQNPSILADLDQSGHLSIGLVRTPHIGRQLQIWKFDGEKLH